MRSTLLISLKSPFSGHRLCFPAAAAATKLLLLLLFAHETLASSPPSDYLSFSFPSFGPDNRGNFTFPTTDSRDSQGALQITPDTANDDSFFLNKSGRVLLSRRFRLWKDPSSGNRKRTASFNTTFFINIFKPNGSLIPGEGLSFLISPDDGAPPPGSSGGYLGLTNSTIDGHSSNQIVAVEFDTVKQSYDPDDNHVGLNINSIVSNKTASLSLFGIQLLPPNPANYTVWIDYDGGAGQFIVHMALQGKPKPLTPVLEARLNLSDYVNQDSYFGFAASTGAADYQLNCVLAWNLTVENLDEKGGGNLWKILVGIAAGVVVIALAVGLLLFWHSKERRKKMKRRMAALDPSVLTGTLKSLPGMPKEFEYKDLRRATNGFEEKMKLGQGGFGIVYKGVFADDGTQVAVKKFSREDNMNSQDDFLKELTVINRLRHKHLVSLLGWCHENGVLLLVYDYMPNGSLDQHLYRTGSAVRPLLPWNRRVQVAADVASALHYLHHEYNECVVHRDLKSSNVMLDAAFRGRLGDFGLARVIDIDKTSYAELEAAGVPGTLGYIAPECFHTARATRESDVFAFGALLLELVCGRRPRCSTLPGFNFLVDWVWMLHREGTITEAVDEKLGGDYAADEAFRLLMLGLACSHPVPGERPKAAGIIQILLGTLPPPVVPPFKPGFMWPAAETSGEYEAGGVGLTSMSTLLLNSSLNYSSSTLPWTPRIVSNVGQDDV
ncbi:putative L-type lectin-domain containing receptor kinase S.5 [Platanthera guangdongensis]|uniref:non-specific serine/threonine protein kinase n=1 Tax=Platanthera guangdongensis TaxID=2320717 RepID=A0ABR2MIU2_9ASPA